MCRTDLVELENQEIIALLWRSGKSDTSFLKLRV